jgi:hypothetical protein
VYTSQDRVSGRHDEECIIRFVFNKLFNDHHGMGYNLNALQSYNDDDEIGESDDGVSLSLLLFRGYRHHIARFSFTCLLGS